jgi:hypothetical protein
MRVLMLVGAAPLPLTFEVVRGLCRGFEDELEHHRLLRSVDPFFGAR